MQVTILVVDGQAETRHAVAEGLATLPYTLLSADSRAQALDLLQSREVDILITALRLTGDGLDLVTQAGKINPELQSILLIDNADIATAIEALHDGTVAGYITLPPRPEDLNNQLNRCLEHIAVIRKRNETTGATILLVDDEVAIVQALASELRLQRHTVHTASSGKDAIQILNEYKIDILITDLRMPGMDGLELLTQTAKISREVQSIVLTGYGDMQNAVEALNRGASGYMLKPPDLKELGIHIEECLKRSALNNAMRRKNAALEAEIARRRQAETALKQAKETAEEANRAKSTFLANMSHEIRTPMTAIIGLSDLATKAELSPKVRDYLTKIKSASYGLLGIINDILDVSKIEAGKLTLDAVPFSLEDVFNRIADVFKKPLSDKNIELILALPPKENCELVGDPMRLEQVLINLVANAVKFTEKGEILVKAVTIEQTLEGLFFEFSVDDTGIGMDPARIPKLFSAFVQADDSTTRKYGGTGLGLTICKHIVAMMGGDIRVTSTLGKGSTFQFTARFQCVAVKKKFRLPVPSDMWGMKVLVVDDSKVARETLQEALRSLSFGADMVGSGKEALAALAQAEKIKKPYPLVFMDWLMPEMDGIETTRKMRQAGHQTKVIMLTAFGREEVMHRAEEAGALVFLTKPANRSLLFDSIMSAFGKEVLEQDGPCNPATDDPALQAWFFGTRVLLAEDNIINQQVIREILENIGIAVVVASNGRDAVRMAEKSAFDLLLMDIQMPEMDGFSATSHIRAIPGLKNVPIIAMTAYAMDGDREKCLAAGMNDHVAKPIDKKQLYAALLKWTPVNQHPQDSLMAKTKTSAHGPPMPDTLPGINVAAGLDRMDGNRTLYYSLLTRFQKELHQAGQESRTLLEGCRADDIETGCRLVHTIRGMAGNLGANALTDVAANLEQAIKKQRHQDWPSAIQRFTTELDQVLTSIQTLLTAETIKPGEQSPPASPHPIEVEAQVRELADHIRKKRFKAGKYLQTLKPFLQDKNINQELEELEKCIGAYDFAEAWNHLAAIARCLNFDLDQVL